MIRDFPSHRIVRLAYLVTLFTASAARAEGDATLGSDTTNAANQDASKAFWIGKEYYDRGQFNQALEQFQRAYALTKDPDLLYDIGQAYRKMGQCELALQNYRQFILVAPGSPLALQAQKHESALESACPVPHREQPTAAVHKEARPTAVARPTAAAPLPLSADRLETEPKASQQPRRIMLQGSVVTLVAGLVAGGVATGIEIWNHGRFEQWRERDADLAKGTLPGELPAQWLVRQQNNDQLGNSINRSDSEVLVLGLGAGALVTTSAILFFLAPSDTEPRMDVQKRLGVSWQPAILGSKFTGVSIRGSF